MTALQRLADCKCTIVQSIYCILLIACLFLQTELALQLCWAIGEHGGGGGSHKDAARELFESLELLLYENLSTRYDF